MKDFLTSEAKKVLLAAADGNGKITLTRQNGYPWVEVDGKELDRGDVSPREAQEWLGGLNDLENYGYVRHYSGDGTTEFFEVTREGYRRVAELITTTSEVEGMMPTRAFSDED